MKIFRNPSHLLSLDEIIAWLREMRGNPHVPASGFDVTSIFRVKAGNDDHYYFSGVNVENPEHRLSTHSEEGSISAIATSLGKSAEIVEGWVMGAPKSLNVGDTTFLANNYVSCCGKCRQQIVGFANPDVMIHSVTLNGDIKSISVGDFLPDAFTFRQFIPELNSNISIASDQIAPARDTVESLLIREGKTLSKDEITEWLSKLEGIDYASKISKAAIIKLENNTYVAGVSIEEAAFVSICPIQSAIAIMNAEFGKCLVTEVHTMGKGRDKSAIPEKSFVPLSGSDIQVLSQFAAHKNIPINFYNALGDRKEVELQNMAEYLPSFEEPFIYIDDHQSLHSQIHLEDLEFNH